MADNHSESAPATRHLPRLWRGKSVGLKLSLLLALLLLVFGAVAAVFSARRVNDLLLDGAHLEALRLADTVKRSTRNDMLNMRWQDLQETVQHVGQQHDIEYVRIYNKHGQVKYASDRTAVGSAIDVHAEPCRMCHAAAEPPSHLESQQRLRILDQPDGHRVLAAIEVIANEPNCATAACHVHPGRQSVLGVLDIGVSLRQVDGRSAEAAAGTLGLGLLATVLVCGLAIGFVYAFVSRPVRRLLGGMQRVTAGDLQASLPVVGNDELSRLAGSFNQMTAELAKARGELRQWANTLERQVEEKTRALQVAQAQVMRSEKLSSLGVLAAGVAHELNSPLTGILTFAHTLLQDTQVPQQREDLQLIVNETNRCATIIRQLLDFARESGPQKRHNDLGQVVQRSLALVEHQALFHNVQLHCETTPDLPPVDCDANQMEQVLLNLLINAAEAMPKGGTITIRVGLQDPEHVVVEVEDTGIGIPAANLGRIFDPFFTSKQVGKGTGLGLAVTYGIVRRHGGTIAVRSTPGVGTTFTITLPAVTAGSLAR